MTIAEISRSLAPGMTGDDVKALQDFLKKSGFFPKETNSTGYYGDITKKAVESWQRAFNIDTKGNYGYFGQISKGYVQKNQAELGGFQDLKQGAKPPAGTATTPPQAGTAEAPQQGQGAVIQWHEGSPGTVSRSGMLRFGSVDEARKYLSLHPELQNPQILTQGNDPQQFGSWWGSAQEPPSGWQASNTPSGSGISPEDWAKLSGGQQAALSSIWDFLKTQYEQNKQVPVELTGEQLDRLFEEAKADPVIQRYYGDQLKMGEADFRFAITQMQGGAEQERREREQKFLAEKKQLSEQEAEAGREYSGFRKQAQDKLALGQQGIIESSQRQLQRNLQTISSEFERKYGSEELSKLGGATIPGAGASYTPYGGIAGELPGMKTASIEDKYQSLIKDSLLRRGATT